MKKILGILFFMLFTLNSNGQTQNDVDYKVSHFCEYGWFYTSIVHKAKITLLCYANKNEYHQSGQPIYILQGTITKPDKRNVDLGEGDPNAGVVVFKTLYADALKKDFIPLPGTIWYKVNPDAKDQLELEVGEATLDVYIAK
jgi:hypothetical protein